MANIFSGIPFQLEKELFEELLQSENIRIERIVSKGHTSPAQGWYDQTEHEWVMVLEGSGTVLFADGTELMLNKGDYINIPARAKHKVSWTDPEVATVWLAIFYS